MESKEYESYHEIKEHYNNKFSYNTYLCSMPLDFPEILLHWHNEIELIYVKKGTALITIDMQEYLVNSGCLAIILPGHIHGIKQSDSISHVEYENIIFDINMLIPKHGDTLTAQFIKDFYSTKTINPCIITPVLKEYNTIISAIDRADYICQSFPDNYFLAIRSCLYDFFFQISSLIISSDNDIDNSNSESLERIKTITKYIEEHFDEEITIQKMANICNISHSHFMKFFKMNMGTSFINYLNDYRIVSAARMLTASNSSIADIAANCGFDNISYFNRLFKRRFNITPKQYRK